MAKTRRIAIIGAGLAGLATGYFLSPTCQVTLFDKNGVGGGTSGMAAGLLHPYVGQTGKMNTFGQEGMEASLPLVKNHILHKGIFRIPINEQMETRFANSPDFQKRGDGYWHEEAYAIDTPAYLQWLMDEITRNGGNLQIQTIDDPTVLPHDVVILCQGWQTPFVQITAVKGQLLEIDATLPYPIAAEGYLLPKNGHCILGSTYERNFKTTDPDPCCIEELLEKGEKMMKGISSQSIVRIKAGVRASTPQRLPCIKKITDRFFAYTGLGSRGLLYHALFAKKLINQILE